MEEKTPPRRPSIKDLSKTPSWVMVGFILGALFVHSLPRSETPAPRPIVLAPAPRPVVVERSPLTTIEAVFAQWSEQAVWENDVTQVALWNAEVGAFVECYEVRRVDGAFYFRSISHLTNRVIQHGKAPPAECPLRFTETEEQYQDWRAHDRFERPAENPPPTFAPPPYAPPSVAPPAATKMTPVAPPAPAPIDQDASSLPQR